MRDGLADEAPARLADELLSPSCVGVPGVLDEHLVGPLSATPLADH